MVVLWDFTTVLDHNQLQKDRKRVLSYYVLHIFSSAYYHHIMPWTFALAKLYTTSTGGYITGIKSAIYQTRRSVTELASQ